jgi:type I restriction enzyme, S subunit
LSNWKTVTWGDVVTLQRGYDITKDQQVLDGAIPVVSSGGISSYHNRSMNDGPGVIIGRKGTLGRVHYVDGPFWPHDTTLWVNDFKGSLPRFVYYALLAIDPAYLNVGSASPTLNRNHFHPLPVRWPETLSEQRAIAEVLGALDDKIAANKQIALLVDELAMAEFRNISDGRSQDELSSLGSVNVAVSKPKAGRSLRYIDISSVGQGSYAFPDESSWDDAPGRARRVVRPGDTIWSTVRPNRRSHALILDEDPLLIASTGLAVLTPKSERIACLYEATRTEEFVSYLESVAEGSAYPAVRADRFASAPIPDLGEAEWDRFEAFALPLRQRAYSAGVESRHLDVMRDELLPLLMSGKVRVRDAEKVVEGVV